MATYVVKSQPGESGDPEGKPLNFKHRHFSRHGHPCAQPEYDRRLARGEQVTMTRWQDYVATVVARWDDRAS